MVFSDDLPPQLLLAREGDDLVGLGDVALQLAIAFHHRLTDNLFIEVNLPDFSEVRKFFYDFVIGWIPGSGWKQWTGRNQGQTRLYFCGR